MKRSVRELYGRIGRYRETMMLPLLLLLFMLALVVVFNLDTVNIPFVYSKF